MIKRLFILTILLTSCTTKYITNQDGGIHPKKQNFFKYKDEFKLGSNSIIDTNAIYFRHIGTVWYGDKDSIKNAVVFYRFYSSGHLCISPAYDSIPSLTEINNIKTATVGFYKVVDSKIEIEYLYPVDIGKRMTATGHIENGNLLLFEKNTPATWTKPTVWTKTIIKGMKHTKPDW